jgi:general secretion pathway protein L
VWLSARLPKASRREQERLLRFAFEDQLVQEPDSQHFRLTDHDGEQARVIVVARERLRQLLAQLAALGRAPQHMQSELEADPPQNGIWRLDIAATHGILRGGGANAFAIDLAGGEVPPALLAAAQTARTATRLPAKLVLRCAPEAPAIDAQAWENALGMPVELGPAYRWAQFEPGTNILQGEFRPAGQGGAVFKRLKAPLMLLGGVVALSLLASLGEVLWQRQQLSDTRGKMQTVFRSAFPNQPLVDAPAQMRSQLNQIRRTRGLLGDDDLLALLASVGEALGADARDAVSDLRYEAGRLELTLAAQAAGDTDAIVKRLQARGLAAGKLADGKLALRREIGK